MSRLSAHWWPHEYRPGALFPCIACTGSGVSSKGAPCHPCKGTGSGGWISPSQLKGFIACELKWWFEYVCAAPRAPTTAKQVVGIRAHGQLEARTKHGKPLTDPLAIRLASHVPVEGQAEVSAHVLIDRIGFFCIADLWSPPVVYDYKTSSDPHKYGLTAEELPRDPQAIILAHAFPEAEILAWVYASTTTRDSFPVSAYADDARANAAQVTVPADRLIQVRTGRLMPTPNLDNCHAYGQPCPHIPYCPAKENQATHNPFEDTITMPIDPARLEAARARLAANGALPSATPAAAPAAAAMSPLDKARAAMAAKNAAATPAAPAQSALDKARAAMAAAKEAEEAAAAEAALLAEAEAEAEAEALAAAEAEAAAAVAASEPAPSALEKARANIAAQKAAMAGKPETLPGKPANLSKGTKTIGVLYIDCMPDSGIDGGDCVDAHDIVESAHARVRKAHNVPHYAAMEYGQGKPALECAIAEILSERGADAVVAVRVEAFALPAFIRASKAIVRALA